MTTLLKETNGRSWIAPVVCSVIAFIGGIGVQGFWDRSGALDQIRTNTQTIKSLSETDMRMQVDIKELEDWKQKMIAEHADLERRVIYMEKH